MDRIQAERFGERDGLGVGACEGGLEFARHALLELRRFLRPNLF